MKRLEIISVGNPKFPRFIIHNCAGEVFDGEKIVADRKKAMLFAEGMAVALAFNALQEEMFKDCPLKEYTVALNIRVRAASRYTQKQLEEYLERAVSILIDHDKGTGPVENSMVQLDVTWAAMQETNSNGPKGKG